MYRVNPLAFYIYKAAKGHAFTPRCLRFFYGDQIPDHINGFSNAIGECFTAHGIFQLPRRFRRQQSKRGDQGKTKKFDLIELSHKMYHEMIEAMKHKEGAYITRWKSV